MARIARRPRKTAMAMKWISQRSSAEDGKNRRNPYLRRRRIGKGGGVATAATGAAGGRANEPDGGRANEPDGGRGTGAGLGSAAPRSRSERETGAAPSSPPR